MSSIPLPRVSPQVTGAPAPVAPGVTPSRNGVPQQIDALGDAVLSAGIAGSSVAHHLQDQFDDAKVKSSDLALAAVLDQQVDGFRQLQAADAVNGAKKQYLDEIDKQLEKIQGSLTNTTQREMFQQAADWRLAEARRRIDAHEAEQTQVWAVGESSAMAERHLVDARRAYTEDFDLAAYKASVDLMIGEVDTQASLLGAGEEASAAMRRKALGELQRSVVGDLLAKDTATSVEAAKVYFAHAGEIDDKTRRDLQDDILRSSTKFDGWSLADSTMAEAQSKEPNNPVAQEAYSLDAIASANVSPQVREVAARRAEQFFAQQRANEAREKDQLFTSLENTFLNPDNRGLGYEDLSTAVQRQIEKFGLKSRALALARGDARSDPAALRAANSLDDNQLRNMPLSDVVNRFVGYLSRPAVDDLTTRWKMANGWGSPQDVTAITDDELIQTYMEKPEFGAVQKKKVDEDVWRGIKLRIEDAWTKANATTRKAKREVLDEMLTDLVFYDPVDLFGVNFTKGAPRAFAMLNEDERQNIYAQTTTEGLVRIGVPSDVIAPLRNVIEEFNRNSPTGSKLSTNTQGLIDAWVRFGRPQSPAELQKKLAERTQALQPVPADVVPELSRRIRAANKRLQERTTGHGGGDIPLNYYRAEDAAGVRRLWQELGSPMSASQLPEAAWWEK